MSCSTSNQLRSIIGSLPDTENQLYIGISYTYYTFLFIISANLCFQKHISRKRVSAMATFDISSILGSSATSTEDHRAAQDDLHVYNLLCFTDMAQSECSSDSIQSLVSSPGSGQLESSSDSVISVMSTPELGHDFVSSPSMSPMPANTSQSEDYGWLRMGVTCRSGQQTPTSQQRDTSSSDSSYSISDDLDITPVSEKSAISQNNRQFAAAKPPYSYIALITMALESS